MKTICHRPVRFEAYAMKLNELNHQVMAVDRNEERVNAVLPFVTNANWRQYQREFLSSLGSGNFDSCIVPSATISRAHWRLLFAGRNLVRPKVLARASTGGRKILC